LPQKHVLTAAVLEERTWQPGALIHHSDRRVQYASRAYTKLLVEHEIRISMSRRGSPYENARAERFMRTLKAEEVQGRTYENVDDTRRRIGEFLEEIYNRQRLHSALRYLTPDEFEKSLKTVESDSTDGNVGKPKAGFPTFPQALEIPPGFPHFPPPGHDGC
jgi:transposase InsO family protein